MFAPCFVLVMHATRFLARTGLSVVDVKSEVTLQFTQDEWNQLISQYPPGTTVSGA
jgi:hypothetical protein